MSITSAANSILKAIENSEKILLPSFSVKLNKMAKTYPEDQTIGQMANVVAKMSSNMFITRAEIKDLYNRLYTRNTKFASLFSDEIGKIVEESKVTEYSRDTNESGENIFEKALEQVVDPVLGRALASAFGDPKEVFTDKASESACSVCKTEISDLGLEPQEVKVMAGQEDLVICSASFDTPKGKTRVLIPVEIQKNKALSPNMFVGNAGPTDLNKDNLIKYLTRSAGLKLNVDPKNLLKLASEAKNGKSVKTSNVEVALTKFNSTKEQPAEFMSGNILFQKLEEPTKNLEINTPELSESKTFEEMLGTTAGVAEFTFGKEKVNRAKSSIVSKLESFGFSNIQIRTSEVNKKEVLFAISADSIGFKVPVKMNEKVIDPSFVIANGAVKPFSKVGLNSLMKEESSDYKAATIASPLYNIKNSELIEIVRKAMSEKNYAKAEDALNVIQESGDSKAFETAFNEFKDGLTPQKEVQASKCSFIIKSANSKFPLCGHTNLPLHKVYQDKHGDCLPMHRKGQEETYEGATFMAHKILL